jgi:hypothetical protein
MPSSRIRTLHEQYFSIFEACLGSALADAATMSDRGVQTYIATALSSGGIACSFEGHTVSAFEYRLAHFTQEITDFWAANLSVMRDEVRNLPGWHLQLPYAEYGERVIDSARRAAVYFDTVVVFDGFLLWKDATDLGNALTRAILHTNFRRAVVLYRFKPLTLLETDIPVVAILNSNDMVPETEETNRRVTEFYGNAFHGHIDVTGSFLDQIDDNNADDLLALARRSEHLSRFLSDLSDEPRSRLLVQPDTNSTQRVFARLSELPPRLQMVGMIMESRTFMSTTIEYERAALAAAADVTLGGPRWELQKALFEQEARVAVAQEPFSEEELTAVALQETKLEFLTAISDRELQDLRQHDGLSEIRRLMTSERRLIKGARIEEFRLLAEKAADRLIDAIRAFETELKSFRQAVRKTERIDVASMAIGATLAIASIAVPVLSIPAAVFGVGVGARSVRDTINGMLASKRAEEQTAVRPLAILYRVHERYGATCSPKSDPPRV